MGHQDSTAAVDLAAGRYEHTLSALSTIEYSNNPSIGTGERGSCLHFQMLQWLRPLQPLPLPEETSLDLLPLLQQGSCWDPEQ
jgi:hypothetical protein